MQIWSSVAVATFKQRTCNQEAPHRALMANKGILWGSKCSFTTELCTTNEKWDLFHTCYTPSRLPQAATSQKAPMKARLTRAANSVTKLLPITISLATVPADVASAETVHGPPRQAASPRIPPGESRHACNFSPSDDSLEVVATVGALLLS